MGASYLVVSLIWVSHKLKRHLDAYTWQKVRVRAQDARLGFLPPRCRESVLTNQGWKMKMEPIHRVQGTGSHLDFMIPWRSCSPNLIIWGCTDPGLAVGQQRQHLLGALRNADSGTPLLLRQNLHCTSFLGNWCNYSSWKSNGQTDFVAWSISFEQPNIQQSCRTTILENKKLALDFVLWPQDSQSSCLPLLIVSLR